MTQNVMAAILILMTEYDSAKEDGYLNTYEIPS